MNITKQNPVREKGEFSNKYILLLYDQKVELIINHYREQVIEKESI